MPDGDHADEPLLVKRFVRDPVGPAAGRLSTLVLQGNTLSEPLWILVDGIKRLEHGGGYGDGQPVELPPGGPRDD
jgi:hypothetical protein